MLEVNNLSFAYNAGRPDAIAALQDVNLRVAPGAGGDYRPQRQRQEHAGQAAGGDPRADGGHDRRGWHALG
jgi:hypothetical protein